MTPLQGFESSVAMEGVEDVFQTPRSQPPPSSLNPHSSSTLPSFGYNTSGGYYHQSQAHLSHLFHPLRPLHPSHPMATNIPRPENLISPSRVVYSAPRTPDIAAVQAGAFAGPDHDFKPKFDQLFHMAERYCYHHLNFPSAAKDQQIPASTKEMMINAATQAPVYPLVSTGATRYFLMTKVILQWMIKHLFIRSVFAGLDADADLRIARSRDSIFVNTPTIVRHQLLLEIRNEIQQLRQRPDFQTFLDALIAIQATKLWAIIQPVMHKKTAMDWEDLKTLMKQGYLVAADMAALPYEWRFDFTKTSTFYNISMINRDPYIRDKSDQQIASEKHLVRLCFIPAVRWRDNAHGQLKTGQITRPQVLIVKHNQNTPPSAGRST